MANFFQNFTTFCNSRINKFCRCYNRRTFRNSSESSNSCYHRTVRFAELSMYSVSMISRSPILSTMVDNLSKITSHKEVQNNHSKVLLSHIKPDKLSKPWEYSIQTINEDITSHQYEEITSHHYEKIPSQL